MASCARPIDVRFPTCITGEELIEKSKALAATGEAEFIPSRVNKPFYIHPESPAIDVLMNAYRSVTGSDKKPFTMAAAPMPVILPMR